jgi:hypothetical protein
LDEHVTLGQQYHISIRVDLSGTLDVPATPVAPTPALKTLSVKGASAIEYDERILRLVGTRSAERTARIYRRIDFQRDVGGRSQQLSIRPAVRRVILLRLNQGPLAFSPDGPLTFNELDLLRTDVFVPALATLLPSHAVRPGERWHAGDAAIRELTDLGRLDKNQVDCNLEPIVEIEHRRIARVSFSGTAEGINEDGPNRQQVDGYLFFDVARQQLSYLYLHGISSLLDKDGKTMGRIEGHFTLTRQTTRCRELEDEALQKADPDSENTLLLFDDSGTGLQFLYPRTWRISGSRGNQLTLDEIRGSGLLITLEPLANLPSSSQYLKEVQGWLARQRGSVTQIEPIRPIAAVPGNAERFIIRARVEGKETVLNYSLLRQPAGGAILAARLNPAEVQTLEKDLDRMLKGMRITRPPAVPPK